MTVEFAHLQLHTHYSVSEGLCRIDAICDKAKSSGIFAVALTDKDNLFAWVKFYRALRSCGVKPIPGADILVSYDSEIISVTTLCLNDTGYQQLITLISEAYQREVRFEGRPIVCLEALIKAEGIAVILHPRYSIQNYIQANKAECIDDLLKPFD